MNPTYPVTKWVHLLPQSELTLNLLQSSRVNPQLSVHAYLHGFCDFAHCPMSPPGTKVVIHEKSSTLASWGYHGLTAFYVAPVTEHYRCLKRFIPAICSEWITDTVQLFPHKIDFPSLTLNDLDKIAAILYSKTFHRHKDVLQGILPRTKPLSSSLHC